MDFADFSVVLFQLRQLSLVLTVEILQMWACDCNITLTGICDPAKPGAFVKHLSRTGFMTVASGSSGGLFPAMLMWIWDPSPLGMLRFSSTLEYAYADRHSQIEPLLR